MRGIWDKDHAADQDPPIKAVLAAEDYLKWSNEWLSAVYWVLKSDGTFWLAIGDDFAAELKVEAQKVGFHCRSWVIWYYTFGVNCKNKFTRSHTHLFYFVKDRAKFTFREYDLKNRIPSARAPRDSPTPSEPFQAPQPPAGARSER